MALYSVTVDLYSQDQPVCTQVAISATPAGADWDQIMGAIETALHEQFQPDDVAHFEVDIGWTQWTCPTQDTDQVRAYLALREQITRLREEHGEDVAWWIVESAVKANMATDKIFIHKVQKPQLKCLASNKKTGETA